MNMNYMIAKNNAQIARIAELEAQLESAYLLIEKLDAQVLAEHKAKLEKDKNEAEKTEEKRRSVKTPIDRGEKVTENLKEIGERIIELRTQKKMNIHKLSTHSLVSGSTITRLELNKVIFTYTSIIKKIAKALGCSYEYLINGQEA